MMLFLKLLGYLAVMLSLLNLFVVLLAFEFLFFVRLNILDVASVRLVMLLRNVIVRSRYSVFLRERHVRIAAEFGTLRAAR